MIKLKLEEEMEFSYSETENDIQIDFESGGYVMSIEEVRNNFPSDYLIYGHEVEKITVKEYLDKISKI